MKKQLLIWMLLVCLLIAAFPMNTLAANEPAFLASDVSGCAGSTVDVSFAIKNNAAPGIVGAELKGTYDATKLEFVSAKNGSVMGGPICNTKDGNIYYSWDDSLTSGIVGDGVMCTLTFKILDSCKPGDKIGIQITQFKAHNTDLDDVSFRTVNASVTVTNHAWGTPTYTWSSDKRTCTATRSQTCGCGGVESETANSTKKEEPTQTIYTASFQNSAFASQTKKVAAGPIKVIFRLIGATQSENGVDLSKGSSDSEYVTWIPTKTYTIDAGSTAYDLIKKALDGAGLKYTMTRSYLSAVYAPAVLDGYELAEFTNGSRSGWMFTVNGKHGSLSIGDQVLKDGDVVIVHYVNDYLYEESKFPWLGAPDVTPTKPADPEPAVPINPTDPAEPTNPVTPTDPVEPTNPDSSTEPSESTEPSDATDPTESTEPSGPTGPSGSEDPKNYDGECSCWRCRFWWLVFLAGLAAGALITWGAPKIIKKCRNTSKENEG